MARPLDNALLTPLARLRARRRGATNLVLLAWLLVAQTALVVHRIDHNAADHNTLPQAPTPVASAVAESAGTPTLVSYRSRAPPQHSRA
jgi:hypothetical protein